MRVIAGTYRSRLLAAPRGAATRPTSDRLRETLFNVLAPRVPGARFADLYAGSGAVGIEALSRGAAHVVFVERAAPALAAIRANLAALKVGRGYTLEERGTAALLRALAARAAEDHGRANGQDPAGAGASTYAFDLIFLDPPWEAAEEYESTLGSLGGSAGSSLLRAGALVIAEHAARNRLPERVGILTQTRTLKQGDAALSFYRRAAGEQGEAG